MAYKHHTLRGSIRYTSKKPERMDAERGREYFSITRQSDDVLVMRLQLACYRQRGVHMTTGAAGHNQDRFVSRARAHRLLRRLRLTGFASTDSS